MRLEPGRSGETAAGEGGGRWGCDYCSSQAASTLLEQEFKTMLNKDLNMHPTHTPPHSPCWCQGDVVELFWLKKGENIRNKNLCQHLYEPSPCEQFCPANNNLLYLQFWPVFYVLITIPLWRRHRKTQKAMRTLQINTTIALTRLYTTNSEKAAFFFFLRFFFFLFAKYKPYF